SYKLNQIGGSSSQNVEHLRETLPHPYIHSHSRRRVKMANWRLLWRALALTILNISSVKPRKLGLSAMTVGRNDPPGFLLWYNSQRPSKPFFQMSFLSLFLVSCLPRLERGFLSKPVVCVCDGHLV
ncbi:hypothetical protein PSTT_01110, partial [Puccinia striiformis]